MSARNDVDSVDPGIRRVVAWLRAAGFETTDSGDGVTKLAAGQTVEDDGVLDFAHVHMTVARESLIVEAERLAGLVVQALLPAAVAANGGPLAAGLRLPETIRIEACYLPIERVAVLSLFGLSDEELPK